MGINVNEPVFSCNGDDFNRSIGVSGKQRRDRYSKYDKGMAHSSIHSSLLIKHKRLKIKSLERGPRTLVL